MLNRQPKGILEMQKISPLDLMRINQLRFYRLLLDNYPSFSLNLVSRSYLQKSVFLTGKCPKFLRIFRVRKGSKSGNFLNFYKFCSYYPEIRINRVRINEVV